MTDNRRDDTDSRRMTGDFSLAVNESRVRLLFVDPVVRASEAGIAFADGAFRFRYLGQAASVGHPEGECLLDGAPCPGTDAVLLLHYVLDGRNAPPLGRWISYREIPDSTAYLAAFQSRGPDRIARTYGDDADGFAHACESIGAAPDSDLPGLAYVVRALPGLSLALILHEGEPGLPAGGQILYDAGAPAIWCAEDLAVLGESAAARLAAVKDRTATLSQDEGK